MQPEIYRLTGIHHLVKRLYSRLLLFISPAVYSEIRKLNYKSLIGINGNNMKTFEFTPQSH